MPRNPEEGGLSTRAQHLLKTLVQQYIRDGVPVGSRALSRDSGLDLSPATVRNVMADLEEMGLVSSPHTSAGRVPTVQGYRLFVDTLLTIKVLDTEEVARLQSEIGAKMNRQHLLEAASNLLSDLTHLASIVRIPRQQRERLRHVEFLSLSDNQVLAILVVNDREVQNRIIRTARRYSAPELQQAANYLNSAFAGKDPVEVREQLLHELQVTRERMDRMMLAAIDMADKAFSRDDREDELVVAGQTHLMECGDLSDVEKLRQLFDAFNRKRDILHLLDLSQKAHGVQLFIGNESGYQVLDGCSVVASPYGQDGQVFGVLGVIGPTRMAYERVIPIVDMTARLVGAALNQQH